MSNGSGSGTVIYAEDEGGLRKYYVITCKHVISGLDPNLKVHFPNGSVHKATFVVADSKADLAIIYFTTYQDIAWAPVASAKPPIGTPLSQVGYPGGQGPVQRTGRVSSYMPWSRGTYNLVVSFQVRPGDSGSGVFVTAEKALCGVIWGVVGNSQHVAVEWSDIKRFTDVCLPKHRPRPPPVPPVPPPVPPVPPPHPAPNPAILEAIRDINKRIAEIESRVAGKEDIRGVIAKIKELEDRFPGLRDKLKELEGQFPGLLEKIGKLAEIISGAQQGQAPEGDSDMLTTILSLLGIGIGLPGISVLGYNIGSWWLRRRKTKLAEVITSAISSRLGGSSAPVEQSPPPAPQPNGLLLKILLDVMSKAQAQAQASASVAAPSAPPAPPSGPPNGQEGALLKMLLDFLSKSQQAQVPSSVTLPFPSEPQATQKTQTVGPVASGLVQPSHEIKWVPYEVMSKELQLLLKAMEIVGRDYPGTQAVLNLIQSLKKQLEAQAPSVLPSA